MHSYKVNKDGLVVAEHVGKLKEGWIHSDVSVDTTKKKYIGGKWEDIIMEAQPLPEAIPETLTEIKNIMWNHIKGIRDVEESRPFLYMDHYLDLDSSAMTRLNTAINAARTALLNNMPFTVNWTCYDGSVLTMAAADLVNLPLALAVRTDSLHQKARRLKALIDSADTAEEVKNITWNSVI